MTTSTDTPLRPQAAAPTTPDFPAIKTRQKAAWSSGDYAVVGTTLQIVGETLCEAADLRAGERVLDVAAGNGNATLAAARRGSEVTSTDYVPALLERGRERAAAERLQAIQFREADAEALPFEDGSFDAVLSTFGCMFAPNGPRVAAELQRVCRPGGRIAMANWTPEGFIGQLFKLIGRHVPPPAGITPPATWGTRAFIDQQFGPGASSIRADKRHFMFRYRSADHMLEIFRSYYGPVLKTFAALDEAAQQGLAREFTSLMNQHDTGRGNALVIPGEYLEIVVTRR
ncbi:methyltransferase domain-containing protein [Ramlibacter sp. AW1]|uniref:Methyltransferase domain-containing protein n=1 Tax=Ramlibacter aurantiacus TaxID=2801330 RepID=A0A936ZKP1_9BURK|nr:methyltransferase domain-containing protein [Ramlibacter aurantiacus]MBL0419058.1 methyltransferase domain-containing protein [Ramlibacter aurantiacus]